MHSCSLENLRWRLVVSILGALFGAFNATGNCKIHFARVSENYRLLLCWLYEILHLIFSIYSTFTTTGRMSCLSTQLHSFPFLSCSLCLNSEDHMRVDYIKDEKHLYRQTISLS